MAVCFFLGHNEIYDADISSRLQTTIEQIIAENETVEFWVCGYGDFYNQCLLAVMRARSRHPQKVTLTLVAERSCIKDFTAYNDEIPLCVADKIVALSIEPAKNGNPTLFFNRLMRWMIQNATHLITYVYKNLHHPINRLLKLASKQSLELFSIISSETEQTIIEYFVYISDRERFVLEQANAGLSQAKIAAGLHVSGSMVGEILYHGRKIIREKLKARCRANSHGENQVRTCSIFSMGEVSDHALSIYKALIRFFVVNCDVSAFYIEYARPYSDILSTLVQECVRYRSLSVTIVTDSEEYIEPITEPMDIIPAFHPPYDSLECIAQLDYTGPEKSLGFYSHIIDRSDICICNLSISAHSNAIKNYIEQTGQTILVDIHNTPNVLLR